MVEVLWKELGNKTYWRYVKVSGITLNYIPLWKLRLTKERLTSINWNSLNGPEFVIGTWTFWAQKNHFEVCDLGAFGGHYSSWLNDTGLVTAYAFDGTKRVEELTQGRVRYAPLQEAKELPVPCDVPRSDWSVCVCVCVSFWVRLMFNHVYILVDGLKFDTYDICNISPETWGRWKIWFLEIFQWFSFLRSIGSIATPW